MIAFSATSDMSTDTFEIYLMDDDGGNLHRLTDTPPYGCTRPTWSPDGRWLLFRSMSPDQSPHLPAESYVIAVDGSHKRRLTFHIAPEQVYFAAWLPDGRIVLESYDGWDAYVMQADGTGGQALLYPDTAYRVVARAPDGSQAVLAPKDTTIDRYFRANLDGSDLQPVLDAASTCRNLTWSPDSTRIAFIASTEEQALLCVMNPDGSHICPLNEIATRGTFSWSPDSRYLTCFGYGKRGHTIQLLDVTQPGQPSIILAQEGEELGEFSTHAPSWSPDGTRLVFSAYKDQGFHIYSLPIAGGACHHLAGTSPRFDMAYDLAWGV